MPEIKFTKEQQDVIDARGVNLLVSAAAGSGKTAVLVERIMGLLTEKDSRSSLDRLLVMTFTQAAAAGMRQKIKEAIARRISETEKALFAAQTEGDREKEEELRSLRDHLKTQESLLPRARIATIDAFCQGLIRQYFQVLEIDPSFRVADKGELQLLVSDTMKELLEEKYEEGDADFLRVSDLLSKDGFDEKISDLAEKIYRFADSRPWPERFLRKELSGLETEANGGFEHTAWYGAFWGGVRETAEEFLSLLEEEVKKVQEPDGWKPYEITLTELRDFYRALLQTGGKYGAMHETFAGASFTGLTTKKCPGGSEEKKSSARAAIDAARGYVKERLSGYLSLPEERMAKVSAGAAADLGVLVRFTLSFMERFSEKKRNRGIVDFSDMEQLCLALLYEERDGEMCYSSLADSFAESLDEILIDEYQDSNYVQEAMITALSAERFGRPDVFMVGDVKQSIYGFRSARPELFMEKYRTYATYRSEDPDPEESCVKIELNRNFRSREEVISSVNDVFYNLMVPEVGGIRYDSSCALYAGRKTEEEEPVPADTCRTELLLMEENERDPGTDGDLPLSEEELSCLMIAKRIRELTEGDSPRFKKSDITILLRNSKGCADRLVDMLSEAGIESNFDSSGGYFSTGEVITVLSFLNIINNPQNDIDLVTVLKSPAGGFSDEELAKLRITYGKEEPDLGFYEILRKAAETDGKAAAFLSMLSGYRDLAPELSVHELIHKIYTDTGYYDYVSALPGGRKRRKNLDMLLEKAENYSATSYRGLFNFVRYIEQIRKFDSDYGEAPSVVKNDNVVNITTIHKSKGLEYPVTIIGLMDKGFNKNDQRQNFVMDDVFGFSCDYIDPETRIRYPSLKSMLIREKMSAATMGEELRVLYVAMTRARDKLILTGKLKDIEGSIEKNDLRNLRPENIVKCSSELQLILRSGMLRTGNTVLRTYDKGTLTLSEEDATRKKADELLALREEALREKDPLSESLSACLRKTYAYPEETELKPKVSVSELKAKTIMQEEFSFVRDLEENREMKGAEFGTLVHRAFEILDYSAAPETCVPEIPGADGEMMESVRRIIRKFRGTALGKQMETAAAKGKLFREQHFMIGVPACEISPEKKSEELVLLQGIIDAYIVGDDGITLIDYKTDSVDSPEILVRRYALQLELYARALSQLLRKPVVKKVIYSTKLSEEIMV